MQPSGSLAGGAHGSSAVAGRDRPRFRQDLIAETIDQAGTRFIDVMAPEGASVFRFYEVEYSLACGMDGERDIAGIVKWAQDELGLTPSQQEVRAVIATLGDLGFIEGTQAGTQEPAEVGDLVAGVVAASPEPAAPSPGVELGAAGSGAGSRAAPLPPAPELSLGAPGSAPRSARPTPVPTGDDFGLGASGAAPPAIARTRTPLGSGDVSLDLADHISVRPDDVKEAVRASRVMAAVEVPPDLDLPEVSTEVPEVLDVIRDQPSAGAASAFDAPTVARMPDPAMLAETSRPKPQPTSQSISQPLPPSVITRSSGSNEIPNNDTIRVGKAPPSRQSRPPVELPAPPPAHIEKTAKVGPPVAPKSGASPLLLALLILAFLGAGVFFAWKYLIDKPPTDADPLATPTVVPARPAPPPPPPPPPAPTAKIALEKPAPEDVHITRAGVIETVLADRSQVKERDVVVKLVGDKPLEAELAALSRDQLRLQALIDAANKRLDAAQAANNKSATAAAQAEVNDRRKSLETKQNQFATKTSDLDTFLIHAPAGGTFSPTVKLGQKVPANGLVGHVERDAIPVATFKLASTKTFAANASVEVGVRKGEQRINCTVADVQSDSVKVICPVDPELVEGTDVTLAAPAATTTAPSEPAPAPVPGGAAGSGEAAPAGAAAGSDPSAAPAPAPGSDGK